MTDDELIARLRSVHTIADCDAAADRIEALIAERDALFRRATLAEEWRDHDKARAEKAEAKLAKAAGLYVSKPTGNRPHCPRRDQVAQRRICYAKKEKPMSDEGQWCDPGYCQLAEVSNYAKELKEKLAKAVEALEGLIQQTYDCEKELTEGLHHVDFCGESEPLTNARATLAEIKGESHE